MKLGIDTIYIIEKHSGNVCHNMKFKYAEQLEGKNVLVFEEGIKKFEYVNKNTGEVAEPGQIIPKEDIANWEYKDYMVYRERILNPSAIADIAVQDESDQFRITGIDKIGNYF